MNPRNKQRKGEKHNQDNVPSFGQDSPPVEKI